MKVAILTGGGDVPGLNSAIKGLATGALARGWQVLGVRSGWRGLLAVDADDPASLARWTMPLDAEAVRTIDRFGGTCLHSSRTQPAKVKAADLPAGLSDVGPPRVVRADGAATADCTGQVLANLQRLGVDVLFPIGGDDTLSYGERLFREGFPVIGIPKTMDNDVHGTDYCLGFATAVSRSVAYLHQLRTCTGSHERLCVVEVMGRNCGATALVPAYLASVDRCVIAEVPFDVTRLAALLMEDKRNNASRYAMVTVSEGASMTGGGVLESGEADAYGHRKLGGIGEVTGARLRALTGEGIILQSLGYLVRSGPPDPLDVMVTFNFANLALELAQKREFGRLVRLKDGLYGHASMAIVAEGTKRVEVDKFYDAAAYRPRLTSVMGLPMYLR